MTVRTITERRAVALKRARAASATRAHNGARSAIGGMLDQHLHGGRLTVTAGGESDQLRGGGDLDPHRGAGRRLRLAGWIVGPDHPAAMTPDIVHALMTDAGLVPGSASVCDAVAEYGRLALASLTEQSDAAADRDARAEAAWWADREAHEADRDRMRADLHAWLDRLLHGPKREYAADLVAWWEVPSLGEPTAPPDAWAVKARRTFDRITAGGAR